MHNHNSGRFDSNAASAAWDEQLTELRAHGFDRGRTCGASREDADDVKALTQYAVGKARAFHRGQYNTDMSGADRERHRRVAHVEDCVGLIRAQLTQAKIRRRDEDEAAAPLGVSDGEPAVDIYVPLAVGALLMVDGVGPAADFGLPFILPPLRYLCAAAMIAAVSLLLTKQAYGAAETKGDSWSRMKAAAPGLGVGAAFFGLRIISATDIFDYAAAVGFTLLECAGVTMLVDAGRRFKVAHDAWNERVQIAQAANGRVLAAQRDVERLTAELHDAEGELSTFGEFLEGREVRGAPLEDLERMATAAVLDGYRAAVAANMGALLGVRPATRRKS